MFHLEHRHVVTPHHGQTGRGALTVCRRSTAEYDVRFTDAHTHTHTYTHVRNTQSLTCPADCRSKLDLSSRSRSYLLIAKMPACNNDTHVLQSKTRRSYGNSLRSVVQSHLVIHILKKTKMLAIVPAVGFDCR